MSWSPAEPIRVPVSLLLAAAPISFACSTDPLLGLGHVSTSAIGTISIFHKKELVLNLVPQVPQRTVVPICLHLGLSQSQTQTVATRFIKASHHSPHVVQLVFPPRNATLVPHPLLVIPEHIRRRVSWYGGRQEAQKGDQWGSLTSKCVR